MPSWELCAHKEEEAWSGARWSRLEGAESDGHCMIRERQNGERHADQSHNSLLQLYETLEERLRSPRPDRQLRRGTRWQTVPPGRTKPYLETMASERRAVLESLMGDMKKIDKE
ncbi:hypothetical protein NDU88_010514 [Pleurodeles waltl]|uniref:Uncharacterized protein n=1 Tax=Pleurodeles waltl TaxID=8319 RepID=A0AAV7S1G8_PLEWA|nr:hypothetical protein NDU88_010514 [Pleurodeles waltl]